VGDRRAGLLALVEPANEALEPPGVVLDVPVLAGVVLEAHGARALRKAVGLVEGLPDDGAVAVGGEAAVGVVGEGERETLDRGSRISDR